MKKDLSYEELLNCQNYAERVAKLYKKSNNGELPKTASDAELAIREYNKEHKSFKSMFGYSIRGYIQIIVESIGFMAEI
jgi:hypothetical protein